MLLSLFLIVIAVICLILCCYFDDYGDMTILSVLFFIACGCSIIFSIVNFLTILKTHDDIDYVNNKIECRNNDLVNSKNKNQSINNDLNTLKSMQQYQNNTIKLLEDNIVKKDK